MVNNIYHATFRSLDPSIGRWWQTDPAAESFYGLSPYNSMGNNPVRFNDPDGDDWWRNKGGDFRWYDSEAHQGDFFVDAQGGTWENYGASFTIGFSSTHDLAFYDGGGWGLVDISNYTPVTAEITRSNAEIVPTRKGYNQSVLDGDVGGVVDRFVFGLLDDIAIAVKSPFYGRGDAMNGLPGTNYITKGGNEHQTKAVSGFATLMPGVGFLREIKPIIPNALNPKNYHLLAKPLIFRNIGISKGLGETTFQIGLRYKPTNFMIRLERHSANLIGGGRTYYTHFNTFPVTKLNHFGLNPFKWDKIKF